MTGRREPLEERFFRYAMPEPMSGCWLWTAAVDKSGYGEIAVGRRSKRATHVSLLLHGVDIPPGMCALHRCDNRVCVNPDHLFVGTRLDNARDMIAKGRGRWPGHRNHPKAKPELREAAVAAWRRGERMIDVARALGVDKRLVLDWWKDAGHVTSRQRLLEPDRSITRHQPEVRT